MSSYSGKVLSEGVAIGKALTFSYRFLKQKTTQPTEEKEKLKKALEDSIKELENLKNAHKENEEYISMQILLLSDPTLLTNANKEIDKNLSAEQSVSNVLQEIMNSLMDSTSSYLKERVMDFSDIKERILRNLIGTQHLSIQSDFILVAEELYPSFLIQHKNNILGIITLNGGYSSHGAILCRQFNIPYMISDVEVKEGETIILDTRKQQIITSPQEAEILYYQEVIQKLSEESFEAVEHRPYQFLANLSDNSELGKVKEYGFDGIGLYRTEMIFMNSDRPYTLEEQYEIYSEAVETMQNKSICFRTFDIGDDKQLSYIKASKKGVDNYILNPSIFETQIKAIIKSNHYNTVKIMFPMIYTSSEFKFLKKWVLQIQRKMKDTSHMEFGIMLETEEALRSIETFKDVDFISIGTNDLVLSIYHIRRDVQTADMQEYLKDLIAKLKRVVNFTKENNITLSICGELAAIEPALKEFMCIGITNYSVAAPAIKVLNHVYKEFF
ncbi:MAG: PEP-utilizing enzyme [Roseburia sp.]|nr:PEP-utilizing enzyme [Anaeroplasma bactoclasticum]MCM1195780.1 PEP-utilizing enzyme [Roseburia sp.]MCM1557289.1 PEP-utilizing enzyme [Anaeroplasma bactoclasticum]